MDLVDKANRFVNPDVACFFISFDNEPDNFIGNFSYDGDLPYVVFTDGYDLHFDFYCDASLYSWDLFLTLSHILNQHIVDNDLF